MQQQIILNGIELNDLLDSIRQIVKEELSSFTPKQQDIKDKKLSRKEVMEDLNISEATLHARMNDGTLPYHRVGKRIFFRASEIENALPQIKGRK